ncbi:FHA domain-containing protein [Hyalangium rubrum]|uniref:FHA domain-containing protein n=1 Tax=Hyalangium rubrum TaxID=3103134 RepID=A0ABU5HEQ3_9BACT|nr:FHA domain-containing protein [Hyalangium sp. s54d21]MDY7231836.1 FHA domain-containing protein [Hyalangium sp. s54d21]
MAFQLKIAEGKDAGKEFEFDQDSVLIGRTPECDVVLYDAGVSRKHCRIFSEGDGYIIEDMGSANGTKVNGTPVKTQPLNDGDQITLGPVVFAFMAMASEMAEEPNTDAAIAAPPAEENSTRIVPLDQVKKRQKNKGEALKPEGADAEPEKLGELQRSATRAAGMPAVRPARAATGASPRAAIERAGPSAPPAPRRPPPSAAVERAAPARGAAAAAGLSAAERARIKRESGGLVARIKIFWIEASTNVRRGIIGGFIALGLGLVGLVYYVALNPERKVGASGPEPEMLGLQPIPDSFGYGPGVTWDTPDLKTFTWEYTAATRAVVILHYQSQSVSQGEVVITVNGVDVGQVPPDTLASRDRALELMIPPNILKKGEVNRITFDNTKNPPGEDQWRLWNVWVEKALLPDLPPDQLISEARTAYMRGKQNFERADVGARNRYLAWKSFREAWLMLEAHPEPKPDLYFEARDRMKDAQQELDKTCSKLLLESEGYYNQRNFNGAKHTLDYIREYFPEFDQPCASLAEAKRYEWGM